jgi:hypothetical protein
LLPKNFIGDAIGTETRMGSILKDGNDTSVQKYTALRTLGIINLKLVENAGFVLIGCLLRLPATISSGILGTVIDSI